MTTQRVIAGRYRLDREIARGGMGAVWLARDEVLERIVALKRIGLLPGATLPDLERATREARLAATLNHPHVVAVFDQVADGADQWLVMEYVEGSSLASLIKSHGSLVPNEIAPLVQQAAEALTAAHAAGIVHRDVKPSNMLVTPEGQVKLTDFGIARMEADATLTQTGLVTGSPAYLAPEVASGRVATEASDVWSLGATLFHALAGHPPYDVGGNLMGALYKIVHEEPPRLTNAGWLSPLLASTMVTDPDRRWSMQQVADYLAEGRAPTPSEETVLFEPVAPEPAPEPGPRPEDAPDPARRRTPWVAAVIVAAVVTVLVLLGWVALSGDSGAPPSTQPTTSSTTSTSGPATSPSGPSQDAASAAAMKSFVRGYLRTATEDPSAGWALLTPQFQAASGGFGQYRQWWDRVRDAEVTRIAADPDAGTVDYDVTYTMRDGSTLDNRVTLRLAQDGDGFLISGES